MKTHNYEGICSFWRWCRDDDDYDDDEDEMELNRRMKWFNSIEWQSLSLTNSTFNQSAFVLVVRAGTS